MLHVYCRLTCNTSSQYCNTASHCCFFLFGQRERKAWNCKMAFRFLLGNGTSSLGLLWIGQSKFHGQAWDCGGRNYISYISRVIREGTYKEEWIFWINNTIDHRNRCNSYVWTLLKVNINITVCYGECLSLQLYFMGSIYIFQFLKFLAGF